MRFEVLGPLRATCGGAELDLGEPQQRKLLGILLASANRPVSTERLIDEIWGDRPPSSARHLVHVYVGRLRNALDERDRLAREASGYVLHVAPDEIDAAELSAAVLHAREERHRNTARAAHRLRVATSAWRGPPFGDLAQESEVLQTETRRLEEVHLDALEELVSIELELGHHAELVARLEELTSAHPYRETFWEQRMLALYRCGRQTDALRACRDLRRTLHDEVGIDPGPSATHLEQRILIQDPDLLWEPPAPPSNLPTPLSSFVGRRWERAEVAKLIDSNRLVTLTGPGGVGKTRLAIEVAGDVLLRFPDGVLWVDLAAVRDPGLVPGALAATLGVPPQPDATLIGSLVVALARRATLLVIDNCEHVCDAVAGLVGDVLANARPIHVLATSRTPLHVAGEVLWDVPTLALPSAVPAEAAALELADAVHLFVERGRDVDTGFQLDADNADTVVEICRRLDGLPLAIEMAASRLRVLSPAQIDDALSDRFALLVGPTRGARHETIETALDWSYDLLDPEHQRAFERLSVFAGPFGLDAVAAVVSSSAALDAVAALVDASMLTVVRTDAGSARYRLLETIREYGLRRLREGSGEAAVRAAHAEYFLGLVEQASDDVGTRAFGDRSDAIMSVYPDVRQALDWSLDHQPRSRVLGIGLTLFHLWFRMADAREAGDWATRMLAGADDEPPALRAVAHLLAAFSANVFGDGDRARTHAELAIRLFRESDDRAGLATSLFGRSNIALLTGDIGAAARFAREALEIGDELDDRWIRAGALAVLSFVHLADSSLDDARATAERALSLYRELGDIPGQVVMCPLDAVAIRQGDLDRAESFIRETFEVAATTPWEVSVLVRMADVQLARGHDDAAESLARRAMVRALDSGVEIWFRAALGTLARVHAGRGDVDRAALLLGASRRHALAVEPDPEAASPVEECCRDALGEDAFAEALDRGWALDHEQLVDLAGGSTDS